MDPQVTQILGDIQRGDPKAASQLLPLVYDELRRLAARKMSREGEKQTLQPTALVHEAFLRLVGDSVQTQWENRAHFFSAAAESMRRILIENARKRKSLKRGGDVAHHVLDNDLAIVATEDVDDLLALNEALERLASYDKQLAKLVELRYFTGLSIEDTARILNVSPRTTKRNWAYARAWLRRAMDDSSEDEEE